MTDQSAGLTRFVERRGRRAGPLDRVLAKRMKTIRKLRGITLEGAAALIGVAYQQMHKYESGFNRISALRLKQLADGYQIDINMFFESAEDKPQGASSALIFTPQSLQLAEAFEQIEDASVRETVVQLVQAAAQHAKRETDDV